MDAPGLRELAAAQAWAFSRRQALSCGFSVVDVERLLRQGQWRRLTSAGYVETETWHGLTAAERHLALVSARLLVLQPGWHAARRSAVVAHRLPFLGKLPVRAQLLRPASGRTRAESRHECVADLPLCDRTTALGLAVTTMARTVIDIARRESLASALVVADAALRRGVTTTDLVQVAHACARWPGGRQGLLVANLADGLAESPLESISRAAWYLGGLPMPDLQVEIWLGGRFVARVDMLSGNTIGEADGRGKYAGVDDLLAEKRREQQLRDLGFEVVRWDWAAALRGGEPFASRIRAAIERGERLRVDPRVRLVRTSLARPQAA
jgi:hypothetical protein